MRTILAFGDSLTWGSDPAGGPRHAFADRWPSALAAETGFHVISEGLGGRTTVFDDHAAAADRNGARVLPTLLSSHDPLDLVIVLLGTNDLKPHICGTALGAAEGMARLVQIVRHHPYAGGGVAPKVLIVAPPPFVDSPSAYWSDMAKAESRLLAGQYARVAAETGAAFFDAGTVAACSPLDSVHLDAANTRAVGAGLAPLVRQLLDSAA